ncbi:MAG TPA: hypothetical protein VFI13_06875 [Gemmatimonadales bacterium]|nr:hypothetical protein [Gemmatimonadales bacterium]
MVTGRSGRAGKGSLGCLTTLVFFGAVAYFGLPVGQIYVRQYQFADEMRTATVLATNLTDAVIRRRLQDKADELGLPPEAVKNLKIRRTGGTDRHITIDSAYDETVHLPGFAYTFHFTPHADQPL